MSKIEWCDQTWNPVVGCKPIESPACENCYAERMAARMAAGLCTGQRQEAYKVAINNKEWSGRIGIADPEFGPDTRFQEGISVFIGSMSDIGLWDSDLHTRTVSAIQNNPYTTFLILTKRPGPWLSTFAYLPNCWCGVTAENQEWADKRIPELLKWCWSGRPFVSCEPLLGKIDAMEYISRLGLVIAGGETGPNARPTHPDWIRGLRNQCEEAGTPFFFKQWGKWVPALAASTHIVYQDGRLIKGNYEHPDPRETGIAIPVARFGKQRAGRRLDGREHNDLPWPVKKNERR